MEGYFRADTHSRKPYFWIDASFIYAFVLLIARTPLYSHLTFFTLCYAMLCYAMLCYATVCYATLCCAVLCYATLCYAVLCCAMLCYTMLRYATLCYAIAMLCYAMLLLCSALRRTRRRARRPTRSWWAWTALGRRRGGESHMKHKIAFVVSHRTDTPTNRTDHHLLYSRSTLL